MAKAHYTTTLVIDYDDALEPVEIRTGIKYSLEGLSVVLQRFTEPLPNGRKTRSASIDEVLLIDGDDLTEWEPSDVEIKAAARAWTEEGDWEAQLAPEIVRVGVRLGMDERARAGLKAAHRAAPARAPYRR
jgi:hypothetical protein